MPYVHKNLMAKLVKVVPTQKKPPQSSYGVQVLDSVKAEFDRFCDARGGVKGPALTAAIRGYMLMPSSVREMLLCGRTAEVEFAFARLSQIDPETLERATGLMGQFIEFLPDVENQLAGYEYEIVNNQVIDLCRRGADHDEICPRRACSHAEGYRVSEPSGKIISCSGLPSVMDYGRVCRSLPHCDLCPYVA